MLIINWLKNLSSFAFDNSSDYARPLKIVLLFSALSMLLPISRTPFTQVFLPKFCSSPNHIYLKDHFKGYFFQFTFSHVVFLYFQVTIFIKGNCIQTFMSRLKASFLKKKNGHILLYLNYTSIKLS